MTTRVTSSVAAIGAGHPSSEVTTSGMQSCFPQNSIASSTKNTSKIWNTVKQHVYPHYSWLCIAIMLVCISIVMVVFQPFFLQVPSNEQENEYKLSFVRMSVLLLMMMALFVAFPYLSSVISTYLSKPPTQSDKQQGGHSFPANNVAFTM